MIRHVLILTSLLPLACSEPGRPDDGTVEAYESCLWEGQEVLELCAPYLACAAEGLCLPKCDSVEDCPVFGGFPRRCGFMGLTSEDTCTLMCSEDKMCPDVDVPEGYTLKCIGIYGWCALK